MHNRDLQERIGSLLESELHTLRTGVLEGLPKLHQQVREEGVRIATTKEELQEYQAQLADERARIAGLERRNKTTKGVVSTEEGKLLLRRLRGVRGDFWKLRARWTDSCSKADLARDRLTSLLHKENEAENEIISLGAGIHQEVLSSIGYGPGDVVRFGQAVDLEQSFQEFRVPQIQNFKESRVEDIVSDMILLQRVSTDYALMDNQNRRDLDPHNDLGNWLDLSPSAEPDRSEFRAARIERLSHVRLKRARLSEPGLAGRGQILMLELRLLFSQSKGTGTFPDFHLVGEVSNRLYNKAALANRRAELAHLTAQVDSGRDEMHTAELRCHQQEEDVNHKKRAYVTLWNGLHQHESEMFSQSLQEARDRVEVLEQRNIPLVSAQLEHLLQTRERTRLQRLQRCFLLETDKDLVRDMSVIAGLFLHLVHMDSGKERRGTETRFVDELRHFQEEYLRSFPGVVELCSDMRDNFHRGA